MHSINYSDRSFVLFGGDTINHRDLIKSLGGMTTVEFKFIKI